MGLITKTLIMRWNVSNKDWYISKGYKFTKLKDEFEIKIEDISRCSFESVQVKCDGENCRKPDLNTPWNNYKAHVKEDGKYYCIKCKTPEHINKMIKTKLADSESFENWCLQRNRQDVILRWDYELNEHSPNEISFGSNKKYHFKCPKGIHASELRHIGSFTSGQEGSIFCNACNSFAQHIINLYGNNGLDLYWDYEKNIKDPWKISYGSRYQMVWIKCQEKKYHGSYPVTCNNFSNKHLCPYCINYHGKVHPLDSIGTLYPQVLKIWSNKNKKSPYEYAPYAEERIWWKCLEGLHKDYRKRLREATKCCFRCPACSRERKESLLQEKVRKYLNNIGYILNHELDCNIIPINPKTKYYMPFDNEVIELKLIIEVHGIQHYKKTGGLYKYIDLHKRQLYDRYKKIYAKIRNYNYLIIPYWADNKTEDWKKLIDNKISEIKNIKYSDIECKEAKDVI